MSYNKTAKTLQAMKNALDLLSRWKHKAKLGPLLQRIIADLPNPAQTLTQKMLIEQVLRGPGSFLLLTTTWGLMALGRLTYYLSADDLGSLTFLSRLLASLVHGGVNRLLRYKRSARDFTSQHFYCKLQTLRRRFTVLVLSSHGLFESGFCGLLQFMRQRGLVAGSPRPPF